MDAHHLRLLRELGEPGSVAAVARALRTSVYLEGAGQPGPLEGIQACVSLEL
jgi:hypothetical protein